MSKPRIPKTTLQGKCNTKDLIRFKLKRIPDKEVISSISNAIRRANARIAADLKQALNDAIKSPVWKTTEGSEDLYDTGQLMSSGTVTVNSNGVTIAYDAPYAALVHYGGYIHPYGNLTEKVYLPPRPWVESVLNGNGPVQRFDFTKYYQEEIDAEFR
jgi:phage gpG-like protein